MVSILLVGFKASELPVDSVHDVNFTLCDASMETGLTAKESVLLARKYASNSDAAVVSLTRKLKLDEALLIQMAHNNDVPVYGVGDAACLDSTFLRDVIGRTVDSLAEAVEHITLHFGGR